MSVIHSPTRSRVLFSLILLLALVSQQTHSEEIRVAAIDWCPNICPQQPNKPGYVVELIERIYANSDFRVEIDYFPWSRAINNVRFRQHDALLAPGKKEAPDLIYPHHAVGNQTMCFYTATNNRWQFNGEQSLKGLQIGVAADTSIEELNNYMLRNPKQFQFKPYSQDYIRRSTLKLFKDRFDTFIFTRNATQYELKLSGLYDQVRNAGCVSSTPIYMAFTPNKHKQQKVNKAKAFFDWRMRLLQQRGYIDALLKKYQIDYKPAPSKTQVQAKSEQKPAPQQVN